MTLKVGDKVEVVKKTDAGFNEEEYLGQQGVIEYVEKFMPFPYTVVFNDESKEQLAFREDELKKVDPNKPEEEKKSVKIPKYPDDFYKPEKPAKISDETVNRWIKEAIEYLEKHPKQDYYYVKSGNKRVTVYHLHPDDGVYEIIVSGSEEDYVIFERE